MSEDKGSKTPTPEKPDAPLPENKPSDPGKHHEGSKTNQKPADQK